MRVRIMNVVGAMSVVASLSIVSESEAVVYLQNGEQIIMSCTGDEQGGQSLACHANKAELATFVKCHEQMKDAITLMHQYAPAHSLDPVKTEPPATTQTAADRLRSEAVKLEHQDQVINFFRDTLNRCTAK